MFDQKYANILKVTRSLEILFSHVKSKKWSPKEYVVKEHIIQISNVDLISQKENLIFLRQSFKCFLNQDWMY